MKLALMLSLVFFVIMLYLSNFTGLILTGELKVEMME